MVFLPNLTWVYMRANSPLLGTISCQIFLSSPFFGSSAGSVNKIESGLWLIIFAIAGLWKLRVFWYWGDLSNIEKQEQVSINKTRDKIIYPRFDRRQKNLRESLNFMRK